MSTMVKRAEADFHVHHIGLEVRVDIQIASFAMGEKPKDVSKLLTLLKTFFDNLEQKDFE
jgi:hypothetical protein